MNYSFYGEKKKNTGTNRFDKKSSNQNTADKTKQVLTA